MSYKTKERILTTALNLFNEKGLSEVSTRSITLSLDISQGHLTYYFSKRAKILETLFGQFQDQFLILLKEPIKDEYHFKRWLVDVFEMQYTYRFLFLDFAQVMRESPKIKDKYYKLRILRKQKMVKNLKALKVISSQLLLKQIELIFEFGMMYEAIEGKAKAKILKDTQGKMLELLGL